MLQTDPASLTASSTPNSQVRLLLIEDCRLLRDALVLMVESSGWTATVLAAATYDEVAECCADDPPDVVVVGRSAQQCQQLRQVYEELSGTPLVALGVGDGDEEVLGCAQAGASALLDCAASPQALGDAVQRLLRGEVVCTAAMTATLLRRVSRPGPTAVPGVQDEASLTPREREVLLLIERGWTNKQIAAELGIELRTVKNHVHHLLDKLQVSRRGEAAARLRSARVPPTEALRPATPHQLKRRA